MPENATQSTIFFLPYNNNISHYIQIFFLYLIGFGQRNKAVYHDLNQLNEQLY